MKKIIFTLLAANLVSAQSISLLKDINPGAQPSTPSGFTNFNNKLYFIATSAESGMELWSTDGTEAGTKLTADINPGTGSSIPGNMLVKDGKLYLQTLLGNAGFYSYTEEEGIKPAASGMSSAANIILANNKFFFRINGKLSYLEGSVVTQVDTPVVVSGQMGPVNGKIVTGGSANSTSNNLQLYVYDGAAVSLLKTINPNTTSNPQNFFYSGLFNTLFFTAGSPSAGFELWKTDGTESGTVQVKNINPGTSNSFPGNFREAGGKVFFTANNGTSGVEMWSTDGTEENTKMVKDINPGSQSSNPNSLCEVNGKLYFLAADGSGEARLWESDGTENGTRMTLELKPGYANFVLGKMEAYNGNLYLSAKLNVANGQELYKIELPNLATSDLAKKNAVVYPIPTRGDIFFRGREVLTYDLYDSNGRLINKNVKINDNKAQLSVPEGNYIIVTKSKQGIVDTNKIIVQ